MSDVGKLNILKPNKLGMMDVGEAIVDIDNRKGEVPIESIINQRVSISSAAVDNAIVFWKPLYFTVTSEGRHLNGIEAYELGDDKLRVHPDKTPYIAMSNLMVLEALKLMGDTYPTVEAPEEMMYGTEREKLICQFWKDTFAPTAFQANWAWAAVLAVLSGNPESATREILYNYREQLP